jgi:hypothetical protein
MNQKMGTRRPREVPGTFLMIPMADASFGYGRILEQPYTAFYNYRTSEPTEDLDTIASKPRQGP